MRKLWSKRQQAFFKAREGSTEEKDFRNNNEWKNITNNSWVLKTIQGCEIDFVQTPEQVNVPRQIQFDVDEINLIDNKIVELLGKGAIERVSKNNAAFFANIFMVPKEKL